jgi:hypothetical protein
MAKIGRNTQKVTLPQFMKLTEFIHQEELVGTLLKAQTLKKQAKQESKKASIAPKLKEEKNPRKGEKKSGPLFKSEPQKAEPPRFQQEVFTPLSASFIKVFMAIKGDPAFRWPPKMRPTHISGIKISFVNTIRIMGIQQNIACLSIERLRTLYGIGSWSDSL